MNKECYIGIMSGTSMDGIDVVLCPVGEHGIELAATLSMPFDPALKGRMLAAIGGRVTLRDIGRLDRELGERYAEAVRTLIARYDLDASRIEAIGLHGQTLWHEPEGDAPFTMQLGDPNIVAVRTGIATVADFRRADVALGGQGAPFAPAFHRFVFGGLDGVNAVVNLGGMANITVLGSETTGYDTGPGNVLIDAWMQRKFSRDYDEDGAIARQGNVDETLLEAMLADPYFSRPAPKSTGRESFNAAWIDRFGVGSLGDADVLATLTELTARTVAQEAARYAPKRLLLCGGGAKNGWLVARIAALLEGVEVAPTDAYGVSAQWMEAMAFAWLARMRLHRRPVPLHGITGASRDTLLGGIYG